MPANKNALLRYKTIDRCLRNRFREWTLEDLIEACSDALYEYSGKDDYVSRRTIQTDIQRMRSSELGYNAPIVVYDNKYYTYSDPDYSITDTPLSDSDLQQMADAVDILKQLSGFSSFSGMEDIVGRLEDHLNAVRHNHRTVISFESNGLLRGLHNITPLYESILSRTCVKIAYKPFRSDTVQEFVFSPCLLKEWHNRWFVFGKAKGGKNISNLALDRIQSISGCAGETYEEDENFDPDTWFNDFVGVTKGAGCKANVKFLASPSEAPYIETKPVHSSQTVLRRNPDGTVLFQLEVIPNFELEQALLDFDEGVKVVAPASLVLRMRERLRKAAAQYGKYRK